MFPDAGRLQRTDWASIGLSHLRGLPPEKIDIPTLVTAAESLGTAIDRLAEEFANLTRGSQPLNHQGQLVIETTQRAGSEQGSLEVTNYGELEDGYAAIFRGRVKFIPPLDFGGGGGSAILGWARAVTNWVDVPTYNDSYVDCKITGDRTDTTSDLGDIRVYLPRPAQRDPNVRAGDVIGYLLDANGEAVCITDYLDDKIGTVKGWLFENNIPPGWQITYEGLMVFGFKDGDDDFGVVGAVGGETTHSHGDHDGGDIGDHTGTTTLPGGGSALVPSGSTDPATSSGVTDSSSGSVSADEEGATVNTGFESDNPTILVPEEHVISEPVAVVDNGHYHEVFDTLLSGSANNIQLRGSPTTTNPTNMTFQGINANEFASTSGFNVAIWKPDVFEGVELTGNHFHEVDIGELASRLTISSHSHDVTMSAHSHGITGSGIVAAHTHTLPDMSHSGTLTHSEEEHLPPYVVVCWIKRVN